MRKITPTAILRWPKAMFTIVRNRYRARSSCYSNEQYLRVQTRTRLAVLNRRFDTSALRALIADPDGALAKAKLLKQGNSTTVGLYKLDDKQIIIKRYNLKNNIKSLKRRFRPSKAKFAWLSAQYLLQNDIATPTPIAIIEKRQWLRRLQSYFIYEYVPGTPLRRDLDATLLSNLQSLMLKLKKAKLSHRDLRVRNFIEQNGEVLLLDVDSILQHFSSFRCYLSTRKSLRRFYEHWQEDPNSLEQVKQILEYHEHTED